MLLRVEAVEAGISMRRVKKPIVSSRAACLTLRSCPRIVGRPHRCAYCVCAIVAKHFTMLSGCQGSPEATKKCASRLLHRMQCTMAPRKPKFLRRDNVTGQHGESMT